jgi:hypothetical protein
MNGGWSIMLVTLVEVQGRFFCGACEPEMESGPDIAANPRLSPPARPGSTQSRLFLIPMSPLIGG